MDTKSEVTFVGVDPGAVTGFAAIRGAERRWWAFEPAAKVMVKPWAVGQEIAAEFLRHFRREDAGGLVVGIETPVPGPSILVYGAQMSMLGALLASLDGFSVEIVNPSESKIAVAGRGNATKDDMLYSLLRAGIEKPDGNKKEREAKVDAYAHALVVLKRSQSRSLVSPGSGPSAESSDRPSRS